MTTTQSLAGKCGSTSHELLKAVPGLTYRMLDFWSRTGRLTPHFHPHARGVGTLGRPDLSIEVEGGVGTHACYSPREAAVCARMAGLVRAGFRPDVAARIARETLSSGQREVDLGEGVRLTFPAPWWAS